VRWSRYPVRWGRWRRVVRCGRVPVGAASALAAACVLLSACGQRASQLVPGPAEVAAGPVDCDAYAGRGLLVRAESRQAFRAALGEPDSVVRATVPNRHDPSVTDTVVALHFAELSAVLWKPGHAGATDLLEQVEVRANRYLRWPSLGIGARAEEVVAALSPPHERSATRLVYQCGPSEAEAEPLVFELVAGRVRRVLFNRYVD
ncbi:MAG TPA: hypothetical protein VF212_05295, partial [Longimicrobiales bacterium]